MHIQKQNKNVLQLTTAIRWSRFFFLNKKKYSERTFIQIMLLTNIIFLNAKKNFAFGVDWNIYMDSKNDFTIQTLHSPLYSMA